jgi:N-ethylmaleimide reductase
MSKRFTGVRVGPYEFAHRVALAPLTRMRAEDGAKPGSLMAEYYVQRTSEGALLISEATIAAANGNGYPGAPGLFDDSQIAGWRLVTDAVHAKGGKIFLQFYHAKRLVGRYVGQRSGWAFQLRGKATGAGECRR